jgi:hypothetical protein
VKDERGRQVQQHDRAGRQACCTLPPRSS